MGTAYVSNHIAKIEKVSQSGSAQEFILSSSRPGQCSSPISFSTCLSSSNLIPLLIGQVEFDVSKLHQSNAMAAQHGMVDRGDGDKQVRILTEVLTGPLRAET